MQRRLFGVLLMAVLVPCLLFAQDGKLRGKVTDRETGEALVGANVTVEGTNLGAACDINGDFIILSVPPGVYTIRASYIGYASTSISNIRVSANLTTSQDFGLSSSAVQVQAIEIVAERPLIQRNTTNTVRLTTQEDIGNLPIRGTQNILALQSGVVQTAGNLHVRGGRTGEVAYFVDGANVTNPLSNAEVISVVQEALEEIQLQSGGYTAEFGGSNSGIVRTNIRTGGPTYKASVDYLTDDFAKPGEKFLGTSAVGYRNIVATVGGPIPGVSDMTFFFAGQHNYRRDRGFQWLTPFEFELETDVNDPRGAGQSLPGPVAFEENFIPNNYQFNNTVQGTILWDLRPVKFRVTGSYEYQENPYDAYANWPDALDYTFNKKRIPIEERYNALGAVRMTHVIDASTYYEVGISHLSRTYKRRHPDFGFEWSKYQDSIANAQAGYDSWTRRWIGPLNYSVVNGFILIHENQSTNTFEVNKQTGWGGSLDFTRQMNKQWELKVGGRLDLYTMRRYNINRIANLMRLLYGADGNTPGVFTSAEDRRIQMAKNANGNINYYGYDVDGNPVDDGVDAPRKPVFYSMYVQNKLEYRDLVINFGLRYEYLNPKHKTFPDPFNPPFNVDTDVIDESALVEVTPFQLVLPRISFSFPVTDNTVFYAQYGKYAQMPSLDNIYFGNTAVSRTVSPVTRGNAYLQPIGFLAKPERTTQYEMGIRQMLSDNFAFTLSGFYKDIKDQIQIRNFLSPNGTNLYKAYVNDDFGTVKGIELTLELRRTNRFAARVNYTLSDARGTGSSPSSTFGAVEQNIGRPTNYVNPLDFNQTHRGTLLLDYRWDMNEGGPVLSGLGANFIIQFNSGVPYTKIQPLKELGQSDPWTVGVEPLNDPRFRFPEEPVNSSSTPFYLNIDMNVSKRFALGPLTMEVYVNILNLLNSKQVVNVYPTTGSPEDDGFLSSPLSAGYQTNPQYAPFYRAINLENRYSWSNLTTTRGWAGGDIYGIPRQIRVGLKAEI